MVDAFSQITTTLTTAIPVTSRLPARAAKRADKVEALKCALHDRGRLGITELARAAGVTRTRVSDLLKADVELGKVTRHVCLGGVEYELPDSDQDGFASELARVKAWLNRHGYEVRPQRARRADA